MYRNTGISRFHSYAEIRSWYDRTLPIRGRQKTPEKPQVPLGHRHKVDAFWMRKGEGYVECMCYQTPVVTFRENGDIELRPEGWLSQTTANFINDVLGLNAYIHDHKLCISFHRRGSWNNYALPSDGALILRLESFGWNYHGGAAVLHAHAVDRKAINAKRKPYAAFKEYVYAMLKLRNGEFTREELEQAGLGWQGEYTAVNGMSWNRKAFVKTIDQLDAWMRSEGEEKHNDFYKATLVFVGSFSEGMRLTKVRFDHGFNYVTTGMFRDEVLTKNEVEIGRIQKDSYGKYFRKCWSTYHDTTTEEPNS